MILFNINNLFALLNILMYCYLTLVNLCIKYFYVRLIIFTQLYDLELLK